MGKTPNTNSNVLIVLAFFFLLCFCLCHTAADNFTPTPSPKPGYVDHRYPSSGTNKTQHTGLGANFTFNGGSTNNSYEFTDLSFGYG